MAWNPCLGVNACFICVLCYGFEFWKDFAFQFHVSYGSCFNYFTFPCLCVCEPFFLHSSSFLSLPSSNTVGPVSHITGYPCTNHKCFVPLSKQLLKESFWVNIRRKAEGMSLLSWERASLAGGPRLNIGNMAQPLIVCFTGGFVLKCCPVCKRRAADSDCSGREWDTEAAVGTST